MIEEVKMVFVENLYYIVFPVALIAGILFCKKQRKKFLIPALIISIIILNPVFYNIWYKVSDYGYWRFLWVVPLITVSAAVPAFAIDKLRNNWIRFIAAGVAIAVFILCGSFVYNLDVTSFGPVDNPDKLPEDVVEVGEFLLSIDDDPYVVADASLSQYLRQYSGKIKTLYARDVVFGWANSEQARIVYKNLTSSEEDYREIAQIMLNNDYEYLVTRNFNIQKAQIIEEAGFEYIYQINQYGIYAVTGQRTEIRTYNDQHQIISIISVDEEGNPTNNNQGYSIVQYYYNRKGINELRYYYDKENNPVSMGSGYFHDYLTNLKTQLKQKKVTVIISVRDEVSEDMTETIAKDLMGLGIKTDLRKKYQNSYFAIITANSVVEKVSTESIVYDGKINGHTVHIVSSGYLVGDYSSILIDNKEYSKNEIGLNILVIDNESDQIIDSFAINTHRNPMRVYR